MTTGQNQPEVTDSVRSLNLDLPVREVPGPADRPPSGGVVEIVEPGTGMLCPIPRRVKINGVDVGLIAENGIEVIAGRDPLEPPLVKLILLPRRVVIGFEDGDTPAVD